jgi:hypothetical protein
MGLHSKRCYNNVLDMNIDIGEKKGVIDVCTVIAKQQARLK